MAVCGALAWRAPPADAGALGPPECTAADPSELDPYPSFLKAVARIGKPTMPAAPGPATQDDPGRIRIGWSWASFGTVEDGPRGCRFAPPLLFPSPEVDGRIQVDRSVAQFCGTRASCDVGFRALAARLDVHF